MHKDSKRDDELKQATYLIYKHLKNLLEPYKYKPINGIVGFWKYDKRLIVFCLYIDNFGAKYWSDDDTNHLKNAISKNFRYIVNIKRKNYCRLSLD